MEHQLNTILLLLMFTGLVGVLLVVFFMLDRVNDLHKATNFSKGQIKKDQTFGGLTGKNLWDAMIGVPSPGWSQKKLAELRPRYELVLQKHMELLFEDGKFDGKEGFSAPVRSDRMVTTLRGEVESWIPHEFASGLYNAGFQLVATPDVEEDVIRDQVDMLGEAIYSAAGLPPQPLSKLLMPPPRPERKKDDEENPEVAEEGVDGEETAEVADDELQLSGDAIAALPAPEDPDYLEPQLTPDGELLPVEGEEGQAHADQELAVEGEEVLAGGIEAEAEAEAAAEPADELAVAEAATPVAGPAAAPAGGKTDPAAAG
ncbi:MAG: hypothetical protein RL404_376 [Pseudomonadota bacterium]